ncbi:MAG: cyclic-di-AMP receptor [Anaerolineae bacterium]
MTKLILAMMPERDADPVLETLMAQGYRATLISSHGGFFRRGRATLLIGIQEEQVEDVIALLKARCQVLRSKERKATAEAGEHPPCGITLFVLGVAEFEHL